MIDEYIMIIACEPEEINLLKNFQGFLVSAAHFTHPYQIKVEYTAVGAHRAIVPTDVNYVHTLGYNIMVLFLLKYI